MYYKLPILLIAFLLINFELYSQEEICNCPGQNKVGKGSIYFMWGYNRDWFSKSDIHFKNTSGEFNPVTNNYDSYDFTLFGLKAEDRPGFKKLLTSDLTIPQYNYRLGYYFNDKNDLGIEINFDHTKYVMVNYQNLRLEGTIRGQYYNQDTVVQAVDFLAFEHSDGANFLMLNIIKRQQFLVAANKKHWVSGIVKIGGGIVIPRTDITLFGQRLNNRFHIAGYLFGIESGIRYDAFKYFFMEYTVKGTWANYTNVLAIGNGRVNHSFYTLQNILLLGVQFPL